MRRLLAGAGFAGATVETVSFSHRVTDAGELWDGILSGSVRAAARIRALEPGVRDRARAALDAAVAPTGAPTDSRCRSRSSSAAPRVQVLLLGGRERVDLDPECRELEPRDLASRSHREPRGRRAQLAAPADQLLDASACRAKEMSMTAAGWPSAAARLTTRPARQQVHLAAVSRS